MVLGQVYRHIPSVKPLKMRRFFLISLFMLLEVNVSHGDATSCPLSGDIYDSMRYPGSDFYDKIDSIGLMQCYRQCSLVTSCKSVNYDKNGFTCYIYNFQANISSLETDESFMFIDKITRTKELMGSCFNNKCSREEMCVELNSSPACIRPGCRHKQYTFDEMTKTCFRILTTPRLSWLDAEEYCKQDGARLIKLDSMEKNDLITEALSNVDSRLWTGLNERKIEGIYYWSDGSELTKESYNNWGLYEPDNIGYTCKKWYSDCINIKTNGKWSDDCCYDKKGFICEII